MAIISVMILHRYSLTATLLSGLALATASCGDDTSDESSGGAPGSGGDNGGPSGGSPGSGGSGGGTGGTTDTGGVGGMGGLGGLGGTGGMMEESREVCGKLDEGAGADVCDDVPEVCGDVDQYSAVFYTEMSDTELSPSDTVAFSLGGQDTLTADKVGACLVAGEGDDTIKVIAEGSDPDIVVGQEGADEFVLLSSFSDVVIGDFEPGNDSIVFNENDFGTGEGTSGDDFMEIIADFDGTSASLSAEGTRIIYDPNSGEIWFDEDGNVGTVAPRVVAKIANYDSSTVAKSDFASR